MISEIKKEKFAKFYIKTWSDSRVIETDLFEERFFITSWTNLFSIKSITGIYEINRPTMATYLGFTNKRILDLAKYGFAIHDDPYLAETILKQIIEKFNSDPDYKVLLEYNVPHHIMFVKSYFKFQYKTIGNPAVAIRMILNDFSDTFKKVEGFWIEFGAINNSNLKDLKEKLLGLIDGANLAVKALEEGSDLKKLKEKKEVLREYQELLPKYNNFLEKLRLS